MVEVDSRMSSDVLIMLSFDPDTNESFVDLCDEYSTRRLVAKDRAEAVEMFKHPFAYSQSVNVNDLVERIAAY